MTNHITQEQNENPIFSSYDLVDKNFNENIDSYVPKSAYEKFIEKEQQNKSKKININSSAINNIPTVPDFAMNEYNQYAQMPKWMQELNVATPDEVEQWQRLGKMGIAETWQKKKKWEMIPFAGTSAEMTMAVRNANTLRKLKKGENVSDVDKELLVDFLRDVKQIEVRNGHTLAGSGLDIVMSSLPYIGEFGAALATIPEGGVGFGVLAKTLSDIGAKKAAKVAINKAIKEAAVESTMTGVKKELSKAALKEIGEKEFQSVMKGGTSAALKNIGTKTVLTEGLKATPKIVGTSVKTSLTRMPQHFVRNIADRQLSTGVYVTDAGDAAFLDSENIALSIMKALGDTTFDTMTETSGWMFAPVSRYFAKPLRNKLPASFYKSFDNLITSKYGRPAGEILQKYGYDGVVEEMGEELLNRFLCQTFAVNGLDEWNIDGFLNNVLYADDPSKWASEALAFASTSAGGHAVIGSASKAAEQFEKQKYKRNLKELADKANKKIYSPEEFYLDQGLIRINGSQSLAEQILREKFINSGIDKSTSDEFFHSASELEIRNTLKNFKANETQKVSEEHKEKIASLRNRLFTQSLNAGRESGVAKSESEIMTQAIVSLARISDKSIDDIENQMKLNIKSLNVEDAKKLLKGGVQYNQDSIATAGAEKEEEADAAKEWKEKGTDSKYFKKWFGDSKVVDESGKPIVVYHGTASADIEEFNANEPIFGKSGIYFSSNKKVANEYKKDRTDKGKIYPVYLQMENPYIYDCSGRTYNEIYDVLRGLPFGENEHDGVILKNIDDSPNQRERGEVADTYVVFDSNQIKSVNNQGTFDTENPNIYYQEDIDDKNLIMVHATKSNKLDDILSTGELVAPSMSITKRSTNELSNKKFGDIIFVRNPRKIDFQNDNIYDRDIYSPRLPDADYEMPNGVIIDAYQRASMEREYQYSPEKFKDRYGKDFNEYFKDAKKVMFLGYTPSGNRRYKPYKPNFLLEYLKKNKLVNGENVNYGFSNFLAKFSKQQLSKKQLKETAISNLSDRAEREEEYNKLRDEYNNLYRTNIREYAHQEYKDIWAFDGCLDDILHAIATNNKRKLGKYIDTKALPKNIYNQLKGFTERALSLPRSYFEAKPMRKVDLSEFSYALASKGTFNKQQKKNLKEWNVTPVEYEDGKLNETLENIDKKDSPIYFQNENEYPRIDNAKGFSTQRTNFDGTVKDNLIVLLKNKADKTTLLHEFAHVYLMTLNQLAMTDTKAKSQLLTLNKWLNYNGKEYTRLQHEKFARGFEAYVKSGKAPSYSIKRAFQNFKLWLNDVYTNITSGEMSQDLILDDETKRVFDELLGDMTYDNQKRLAEELIDNAKSNASLRLNNEYTTKYKIKPGTLSDRQIRYRDTAYNILYYALSNSKDENGQPLIKDKRELYMLFGDSSSYKKSNKGIKHRKEKLEQFLREVDDVFSGNDGFLSEWGEFFNDPGVSYENSESGADAELAMQALDVINEKRYLYDSKTYNPNEFSEEDLKRAKYEYEYILDDYKVAKDRTTSMIAFWEWIEYVPDFLQQDFLNDWELKTTEIERYENLTRFQQAKEDLKIHAATLKGFGDYSSQFAEYARAILKRLDFMTEHDKAKIFDKLKEYNSFREIERNLDYVMDYAETLDDVSLRKNLADTIINEIKRTTPEIKNGTKKTRYDYCTNKLFERLRYLNKLSQEEINDLYDAYVNGEMERRAAQISESGTITGKTEDYFEDIENSFLQFKANGIYYNSTEVLQTLLEKVQNAKFTGKIARDEIDFEIRMNQMNWIDNCAKAVESHKDNVGKLEELYSMEANFDSLLSMVFDDKVKNKFTLDDLYAQVDGRVGKDQEEVLNKIADLFGYNGVFKGAMLNNKFIEMANDKYTIKQRYANKEETDSLGVWNWETIPLSRMEILYYYIQAKNPTSYRMLTDMGNESRPPKGQFDESEFNALLDNLSDQEKIMGDILQLAAEKYYPDLNKYHIKKHHIDMGKVTCYFPRKSELNEVNELDLFNQYSEKSTNSKFFKLRTAGPSIRISPANPVNVLFNHIQKANTIIIMGDKLDLMNKVFRDNDLKQKINAVFGEDVYREFLQHVSENLYSGQSKTLSTAEGIISKLMSNIIGAPMFIKPQVGIKQVLGLINYGVGDVNVGTIEWTKSFIKAMRHPIEAIDFMMQDEYLKDRLTRGNMNEALKNQVENKITSRLSLLTDYFSLNMRFGDLLNLCWGGKAYVDALMKKGYTQTQAFELFRKKTISDQQSSIPSTLSNLQRNSKNNPFARLVFAYQNTPHQYFRLCANAIMQAKQGNLSKVQAAKTVFIYWYLLPFIFNMAGSLSPITLITTGDPDELFTDMKIACLGSITCIPFFGEMARALFSGLTGEEYFGNRDWFTRANDAIVKPITKIRKGDLAFEDVLKSLEVFAQGFGIPLEEISTQVEAVGDYMTGDIGKGIIKSSGYSRYRAKKVTGEE